MESVQLSAAQGASAFGIVTVVALCAFFIWLAASSASSPWAWCLPAGMLVMGIGLLVGAEAWPVFVVPGGLLVGVGAYVIKGYREGVLPRTAHKGRYKRSRRGLPPI